MQVCRRHCNIHNIFSIYTETRGCVNSVLTTTIVIMLLYFIVMINTTSMNYAFRSQAFYNSCLFSITRCIPSGVSSYTLWLHKKTRYTFRVLVLPELLPLRSRFLFFTRYFDIFERLIVFRSENVTTLNVIAQANVVIKSVSPQSTVH